MLHERVRGCLWGLAVGDALGEPFEGLSPEEARRSPSRSTPLRTTDDTQLAIATLDAVLELGYVDRHTIARRMLSLSVPRMGPTTKASLQEYAKRGGFVPEKGSTDGAAMRAGPMGLLFEEPERVVNATALSSLTTHGESIAISAACAVACAVWACTADESPIRWALWGAKRGAEYGRCGRSGKSLVPHLKRAIRSSKSAPYIDVQRTFGTGIESTEAVPCAMHLIARGLGFAESVMLAARGGGDADTIASMVGCVIGTREGVRAIPEDWMRSLSSALPADIELLSRRVVRFRGSHRG